MKRHDDITGSLFQSMFIASEESTDKPWSDATDRGLGVSDTYQPTGNERFDALVRATGARIVYGRAKGAEYDARADVISMPHRAAFRSRDDYLSTLAHELCHWTMLRVGRIPHFGNPLLYAREEQTAEIACAIVLSECGAPASMLERRASYVRSWIVNEMEDWERFRKAEGLTHLPRGQKGIERAFVAASEDAERAADFILSAG